MPFKHAFLTRVPSMHIKNVEFHPDEKLHVRYSWIHKSTLSRRNHNAIIGRLGHEPELI
jgi:hypothetical protein